MKDKLSALLDGDLEEQAMRPVFDGLQRHSELRKDWDAYCLIGDALRGERLNSPDFVSRVMAGLEHEPTLLAPVADARRRASGPNVWRSLMPLAASVMGVAAVGLVAASLYSRDDGVAQLAKVSRVGMDVAPVAKLVSPAGNVASGARQGDDLHREYVFAHQSVIAGGPVPAALQYVRSVSDLHEGPGR